MPTALVQNILLVLILLPPVSAAPVGGIMGHTVMLDCVEQSLTFNLTETSVTTSLGIGGIDVQSLEGSEGDWTRSAIGDDISACFTWVATRSNFHLRYICEDEYYHLETQLYYKIVTAAGDIVNIMYLRDDADTDMGLLHLMPGLSNCGTDCRTGTFTQIGHIILNGGREAGNHQFRGPLRKNNYFGIGFQNSGGVDDTMTIYENSYVRFTTDSCARGRI